MTPTRCPHCFSLLSGAAVDDGRCPSCERSLTASGEDRFRDDRSGDDFDDRPRPKRRPAQVEPESGSSLVPFLKLAGVVAVLAAVIGGVVLYFVLRPDCDIHVDNGGSEPITVFLDGSEKATVQRGQSAVVSCKAGSHQITVKRGGKVIFEATKDLESAERGRRKYVLNPERTNRYWIRTVQYGGLGIPEFTFYSNDRDRYWKTANRIALVPVADFFDADVDLVLEPPPKTVQAKFSDSRRVLSRIGRSEYDLIAGADKKDSVTTEDLNRLEAIVDRLLETQK